MWVVISFSMMLLLWMFLSEELYLDTLMFSQRRRTLLLLGTKLMNDCGQFQKQPYTLIMVFIVGRILTSFAPMLHIKPQEKFLLDQSSWGNGTFWEYSSCFAWLLWFLWPLYWLCFPSCFEHEEAQCWIYSSLSPGLMWTHLAIVSSYYYNLVLLPP